MSSVLELIVSEVTALLSKQNYKEAAMHMYKSRDQLAKISNTTTLDHLLATLQPGAHTIAVAGLLRARLAHTAPTDKVDMLHATVAEFVAECDLAQLLHAQQNVVELLEEYVRLLSAANCPLKGIRVLRAATGKLQHCHSPHHLTGGHPLLLRLCLEAMCLKPALLLLQDLCVECPKPVDGLSTTRYLQYWFYGGMVYAGVKDYKRAEHFFGMCVGAPATAVSQIMIEAYRWLVVVSLLINGKLPVLPKHTSPLVARYIRPNCQPYLDLAANYSVGPEALARSILQHAQSYTRDNTAGVVQQLASQQHRHNIAQLTRTFLTLSLTDVATRVCLPTPSDAQQYLLNMIEEGEIHASINQRDGMVLFSDEPRLDNSPDGLDQLHEKMEQVKKLEQMINGMEETIKLNPVYIQKMASPSDEDAILLASMNQC